MVGNRRSPVLKCKLSNSQAATLRWLQSEAPWERLHLRIPMKFYRTSVPANHAARIDSLLNLLVEEGLVIAQTPLSFNVKDSKKLALTEGELKKLHIKIPKEEEIGSAAKKPKDKRDFRDIAESKAGNALKR